MSQLYEVKFQTHYEDVIDIGHVIVCAESAEHAELVVIMFMDLPRSRSVFTVSRAKGVFQIDRHEVVKNKVARSLHASNDMAVYEMNVSAGLRAVSEENAWRKLGHALIERASNDRAQLDKSVMEIDVSCQRKDLRIKPSAVEKQAIYKEKRIFRGGAARPR